MNELLNTTPQEAMVAFGLVVLAGVLAWRSKSAERAAIAIHVDPLDAPLFEWAPGDRFRLRDLLASVGIWGRTGSGKTSGAGRFLMKRIVEYPKSGGLICIPKLEDVDGIRAIFRDAGRADDLYVIHPDGELRCGFLDYIRAKGGDTRETTSCLTTLAETLHARESKGGGDMEFWQAEQARMLYNAVEILQLALGRVTAPDLQRFITTALQNPQQVTSPQWTGCFHDQCMRSACNAVKTPIQKHDFDLAGDYWFKQVPFWADRTRSSVEIGVQSLLHVFNTGNVREMCSTTTNISPDVMLEGKWVAVNMPPSKYGDAGTFVNAGWKYLTQKMILRRQAKPGDSPIVIWCDEFQQFVNGHDAAFLAQCRSHLGCMIVLTQSLFSIFGAMKGQTGNAQAQALLSNFSHKIFHAMGDAESAEFASKLLGQYERTKISGSIAAEEDTFSAMFGPPKITTSFSDQWEPVLEPGVFINGLRTGGPENCFNADAVVVKSGEPFKNGQNWRLVSFNQRG